MEHGNAWAIDSLQNELVRVSDDETKNGDLTEMATLLASCWTSAGDAQPMRRDERSPELISDRIAAVANAGFPLMGLTHADVVDLRDTVGLAEVAATAASHGVRITELEMLMDWQEVDDPMLRASSDRVRDELFAAALELGATHVKVGCDYQDRDWDFGHLVREFSLLCNLADQAGVRIALEPQAICHIKTPDEGLRLIEAAGSATAGLCIDIWHLERLGYPLQRLADIDPARIVCVEISDADSEPRGSLIEDTVSNRKLPGEGSFDLPTFVRAICDSGFDGPWGVEILSDSFRRLPLQEALNLAHSSATHTLECSA